MDRNFRDRRKNGINFKNRRIDGKNIKHDRRNHERNSRTNGDNKKPKYYNDMGHNAIDCMKTNMT